MKLIAAFCLLLFQLASFSSSAQEHFLDTFIRKDGIHAIPAFSPREARTLFAGSQGKHSKKTTATAPLLGKDACDRIRLYTAPSFGKTEPFTYFRVLRDLEAHDSSGYFEGLNDMAAGYKQFFTGLYYVEENNFKKALPAFDGLLNGGIYDSLLSKETVFWRDITKDLLQDQNDYNIVAELYTHLENPAKERFGKVQQLADRIQLPAYQFDKYLVLYNYCYSLKNYAGAKNVYDSLLAYTPQGKMKTSLAKNRAGVMEMLDATDKFIAAIKNKLYFYEIDYLYDHLNDWGSAHLTDRDLVEEAGFALNQKFTNAKDTVYTRWLKDTASIDTLTKYEMLSFTRTPLDKNGRRFVIVKLNFNHEGTYNRYLSFLEKFKSKPVQQSVMFTATSKLQGDEYMLTKHFITSLCQQDDPLMKYELTLYLLEDKDGNVYGVDTLF
jgi:tetratricopeptide (TPR) repeat protein